MRSRAARRAAVIGSMLLMPLLSAAPALALDDGEVKGSSLGTGETILIFIGVPLLAFAVIALLASLPSLLSRPRYRPGRPWQHDPLWFNGPADPDQAVAGARPGGTAKGGASAEW